MNSQEKAFDFRFAMNIQACLYLIVLHHMKLHASSEWLELV